MKNEKKNLPTVLQKEEITLTRRHFRWIAIVKKNEHVKSMAMLLSIWSMKSPERVTKPNLFTKRKPSTDN